MTPGRYGIRGIPALLIFKGGKVAEQIVGFVPKDTIDQSLKRVLVVNAQKRFSEQGPRPQPCSRAVASASRHGARLRPDDARVDPCSRELDRLLHPGEQLLCGCGVCAWSACARRASSS
jgi:hypothetical protein